MEEILHPLSPAEVTVVDSTALPVTIKEKYSPPELVLLSARDTRTGLTSNVNENSNGYLTLSS